MPLNPNPSSFYQWITSTSVPEPGEWTPVTTQVPPQPVDAPLEAATAAQELSQPFYENNFPGPPEPIDINQLSPQQVAQLTPEQLDAIVSQEPPTIFAQNSSIKPQASLEKPFLLVVNQNNKPMTNRIGLYESAVLRGEELCKQYQESFYVMRCVGVVEFRKPEVTDFPEEE